MIKPLTGSPVSSQGKPQLIIIPRFKHWILKLLKTVTTQRWYIITSAALFPFRLSFNTELSSFPLNLMTQTHTHIHTQFGHHYHVWTIAKIGMFLSWTACVNSCKKQCEIIVIQLSGKILNCSARNTNLKLEEPVHNQKNQQTERSHQTAYPVNPSHKD